MRKYGASDEVCEAVLKKLDELGFIDDQRWLEAFVRGKQNKRWGPKRIIAALKLKGFNEGQILPLLEEMDQVQSIFELLDTRYKKYDLSQWKERNKVAQALLRRGFDSQQVFEALHTKLPQ